MLQLVGKQLSGRSEEAGSATLLAGSERRNSSYMHEVDGVRGIALTLVVLFHVLGNGKVSGGVDVFLVLSAYFLSRKLLTHFEIREPSEVSSWPWISRHFLGVAARLIPSAVIVLAAVLIATRLWAPESQYAQILSEVLASGLYYENWQLIVSQLGYEAAGPQSSPLQHFWSLAVQGQFFVLWPLLALALGGALRRTGVAFRRTFLIVTIGCTALSLGYALFLVAVDQEVAYFSSLARFWELGAGALMAFVPGGIASRQWVREAAVWVGLALIVTCGFAVDGGALYPGIATLWPVLATLLILFGASRNAAPGPASRALSVPPVQFLARIAYALYLWHWPILIFYLQVQGHESVGWRGAIVVLSGSFICAVFTERLTSIVMPYRAVPVQPQRILAGTLVPLMILCSVTLVWQRTIELSAAAAREAALTLSPDHIGALALTDPILLEDFAPRAAFSPQLDAAHGDLAAIYDAGCVQTHREEPGAGAVLVCDVDNYGTDKTVVLTGGSFATQWYPAIRAVAESEEWRLVVIEKNGCRLQSDNTERYCAEWNRAAVATIASYEPDAVFTLGTVIEKSAGDAEHIPAGSLDSIRQLTDRGIPVMGVRGTPKLPFDVPDCLSEHPLDVLKCSATRDSMFAPDVFSAAGAEIPDGLHFIDLTDAICGSDTCEPIVGNVLVYRDYGHMTATYARTLASALSDEMRRVMPELFQRDNGASRAS